MQIIPTPKDVQFTAGKVLGAENNQPVFRLVDAKTSPEIVSCSEIIVAELMDMSGGIVIEEREVPADFEVILTLSPQLTHPSPEAYQLTVGDSIAISANAVPGLLYAVATLRQLLTKNSTGQVEFPQCTIFDYPDIEYRCAARWLIELEGTRMMYDWGDGREKMLERYRNKIDFCMRYKINMAFFEGFEWITDKYPQYVEDIRGLNSYASARNVRLEFGGHGIGYGGYPGHTLEGTRGLGGYNRYSYPDGEIYFCGRVPHVNNDPHLPSVTSDAMRNGTCRSNEALNFLKQTQLANYVRALEPGVLFIHNEDIAAYNEFEQMWLNRCPDCRKRWPQDSIDSPDGAAGAIAHGLNCLYEGVASVKNPATGYDGSRDCLVIVASPTYGAYYDDDAAWDKICDFWTAVSRQLGHAEQIMFCMREQFFGVENNKLRLSALARRIKQEGNGHGLFTFVVSGADLYTNNALFTAAPRLNHFFEGSRAIFNFNGGLFAGPQEIYNAEYAWNLHSPYGIDEASDYDEAASIYRSRSEKLEYSAQDQLLKRACKLCYGDAASEMVKFYTLRDKDNNYPAAIFFLLFRNLFRKSYAQHDRAGQEKRWAGIHTQTVLAIDVIDAALQLSSPRPETYEELRYLRGCLAFGKEVTAIVADIFGPSPAWNTLNNQIQGLREFVRREYPHDFTSRFEGEMNLWDDYLNKLLAFIHDIDRSHENN